MSESSEEFPATSAVDTATRPEESTATSAPCSTFVGPYPAGGECAFEVRAFVPGLGVPEDPVTGSLNAGLAQWLIGEGLAPPSYVAAQGAALGRAGRVHVQRVGADIWIGGDVTPLVHGTIEL